VLITLIVFDEAYKLWSSPLCSLLQLLATLLPLTHSLTPWCQRISPGPRHFEKFHNNKKLLRWQVVGPTPNLQAGGPPLVRCPRLLIQYICSFPPSATWGCVMPNFASM
jgi:hypothetical protein